MLSYLIFDGVWILQLVSSETTIATKSSKATFKQCFKLKDAYTEPLEMLALISSVCIHGNVRHHTELFEKSNKIKERKTHSKPATKVWKTFAINSLWRMGREIFLGKKSPTVQTFCVPFCKLLFNLALRWQQKQNSKMILLLIIVLWGILTYWLMRRHLIHHKQTTLLGSTTQASHALKPWLQHYSKHLLV